MSTQPPRKADWLTIRRAYIEGRAENADSDPLRRIWPTCDELATLHGLNVQTVQRRAGREGWAQQREAFQLDVERQVRDRTARERAESVVQIDRRGLSASDAGLALVGHRLAFLLRRAGAQPADGRGADVYARELSTLGLAAWRFVRVKDAVLGTATLADDADAGELSEREQQLGEEMLAARMAMRRAEVLADDGL